MYWIDKIRPWAWVALLIFGLHFFASRLIHERRGESQLVFAKIQQLNLSIQLAKERKEQISREIEAFQDPHWLEEVLKEELGMVPKAETKIVFTP